MSRVAIIAYGAVSALGRGAAAVSAGEVGASARVAIAEDEELVRAGLARPFAGRVRDLEPDADRATVLLERALADCARELDFARPCWRQERVGLLLGTSSGGMRSAELAFAAMARGDPVGDPEGATYFGPMAKAARTLGVVLDPSMLVLAACASSAVAIGIAARWVERCDCDVALAGGFDDVTVFVAAGFEALHATTGSPPPRPFRVGRDGMSLGEGAAVLALARAGVPARVPARAFVVGFGAGCDAVHLTAPDRQGGGMARAANAALDEAGRPRIDLVSAHATATPFNDAAEARALARVFGPDAGGIAVHPFKAQIGHTLGAAGALETLACLDAMSRGLLPAAAGQGAIDPDAAVRLLDRAVAATPRTALKLAAAFGGASAALVLGADASGPPRQFRPAFVHAACHVEREPALDELAASSHTTVDRLARADGLVRLAMASVARLEQTTGALAGAGIVVGSALATVETNALFAARIREIGARAAEPRRFPYTSPNAAPGECAIAFALTGPSLAVGGGMHAAVEAFAVAARLVEAGDAERMVVVGVDEVGPTARLLARGVLRSGAVAVLLSAGRRGARAQVDTITLRRASPVSRGGPAGHLALLPITGPGIPSALASATRPDAFARVTLRRLGREPV